MSTKVQEMSLTVGLELQIFFRFHDAYVIEKRLGLFFSSAVEIFGEAKKVC